MRESAGACCIGDAELDALGALPIIGIQGAGHMDLITARGEQEAAEIGIDRPEGHGFETGAVHGLQRHAQVIGTDIAAFQNAVQRQGKDRLRMSRSVGAGFLELVDECESRAGRAERAIDLQDLVFHQGCHRIARRLFEVGSQLPEIGAIDC